MRTTLVVLSLLLASSAHAGPTPYTATVLNLPGYSSSAAINNVGQVAVNTSGNSLLYTPGVGFTDIGSLAGGGSTARAINDLGQVLGESFTERVAGTSYSHAFVFTPGVGMLDIAASRFAVSRTIDINNAGLVALDDGYSSATGGYVPLIPSQFNGRLTALNENGVPAGNALVAIGPPYNFSQYHAAVVQLDTDPLTGMTSTYRDLGTLGQGLPDGAFTSSYAYDINDTGYVVGASRVIGPVDTAFLSLGRAGAMISLGGLTGRDQSAATGINNSDLIVGIAYGGGPTHGFLYSDGMYDLNALVTGSPLITDISVSGSPDGINDWGQIAAYGTIAGVTRALILNPVAPLTPGIDYSRPGEISRETRFVGGMNYGQFTTTTNSVPGSHGTTATLLDGTAGANRDVVVSFSGGSFGGIVSDVIGVTGTGNDVFVLQLSYDEDLANSFFHGEANAFLGWLDPVDQIWKNAVLGNEGGVPSHQDGAYDPAVDFVLGHFGVDTAANTVWAVLNHNSSFAIVGVPEPSTSSLAICGLLAAAAVSLRRRARS